LGEPMVSPEGELQRMRGKKKEKGKKHGRKAFGNACRPQGYQGNGEIQERKPRGETMFGE